MIVIRLQCDTCSGTGIREYISVSPMVYFDEQGLQELSQQEVAQYCDKCNGTGHGGFLTKADKVVECIGGKFMGSRKKGTFELIAKEQPFMVEDIGN